MRLILASASPRRRELLSQIGVQFDMQAVDIDETPYNCEVASTYVMRMAREKAIASLKQQNAAQPVAILGADTSVIVDGDILGKPFNYEEARTMLSRLSGRVHQVMTSVCLVVSGADREQEPESISCKLVTTDVCFNSISEDQIRAYWETGEPQDKAGSYGIQGYGAVFVEYLRGSYSAVVGLPLAEVAEMLGSIGILVWQDNALAKI